MPEDRLPTYLFVDAHLKQLITKAIPYYIVQKGAEYSGTILLKLNGLAKGCQLLQQQRDIDGKLGWMDLHPEKILSDSDADDYIRRVTDRDQDVWVIEIEDKTMTNPFDGDVLNI